jgi:acetyl esterase
MSQAVRFARYGGPEVLTLEEVPVPQPGPGQLRVAVRASGVNPFDWKVRKGLFAQGDTPAEPAGSGVEYAGTVDAVGPGVEGWEVGAAVFGRGSGTMATHILVKADDVYPKPANLSFEEAAALPVAIETATRTLRLLGVVPGETLLIHAVAGGVGLVAAQLAVADGVRVIGTASAARHDYLRELGVEPVEYGDGLAGRLRALAPDGVDAVLDASGRGALPLSIELAGGPERVLTIADPKAGEYGVRTSGGGDRPVPLADDMAVVLPLLERGALRVPVGQTFPLARIGEAHRASEAGHHLGKIVITVA